MKLFSTLLLLVALLSAALGQTKYHITIDGKPIGTAVLEQAIQEDGQKRVKLTLDMVAPGGKTVKVRSDTRYDAKGVPTFQFFESMTLKPATRKQVSVNFTAEGAHAVSDNAGARKVGDYPSPDPSRKGDLSQFWFLRDKPKAGASVKYYRFDPDSLSWSLFATTYIGPKDVAIGKTKFHGFEIRDDRSVTIVDSRGVPLRIEVGGAVFERVVEGKG